MGASSLLKLDRTVLLVDEMEQMAQSNQQSLLRTPNLMFYQQGPGWINKIFDDALKHNISK